MPLLYLRSVHRNRWSEKACDVTTGKHNQLDKAPPLLFYSGIGFIYIMN